MTTADHTRSVEALLASVGLPPAVDPSAGEPLAKLEAALSGPLPAAVRA